MRKTTTIGNREFHVHSNVPYVTEANPPYNCLPEAWREITDAEFLLQRATGFKYMSYLQASRDFKGNDLWEGGFLNGHIDVTIFYRDDGTGFAFGTIPSDYKTVRFFAFGCNHKYETISWENFDHHVKCQSCGDERHIDTSG